MTQVRRVDHVGFTVEDLDAVAAFFVALGMEIVRGPEGIIFALAGRLG